MSSARRHQILAAASVLLLLAAAAAVLFAASSSVEVRVDGQVLTTRTLARDVAAVLDHLDIEVATADRVDPAPATPVSDDLVIVVARASTVALHLDGRDTREVTAVVDTVDDVLHAAGLGHLLEREARITPPAGSRIRHGDRILVELPTAVRIVADGEEHRLTTYADTVAGALEDAGITLGARDLVEPPTTSRLSRGATITVQRVEVVEEVVEVTIDHGEQRHETDELLEGETAVTTEGRDGLRHRTYEVTLVDGEEQDRKLLAEEVVREPTDRVVKVGTGQEPEPEPEPAPPPVREAQQLLADLGYPVGPVDGIDGPQTQRALCAWRRLEGREVSRRPLQPGEVEALRATDGLPDARTAGRGVTVDNTCQVLYLRVDGRWQHVYRASTGTDGLPRAGSYTISWKRPGWHTSTLYPAPEPNMYNSMYFHGSIAIHGSRHVPPHPASAGCVRVTPTAADQLFATLRVGDPVRVIGAW